MSYSRFIGYIIGLALLATALTWSVNYVVDPYSLFGTKFFSEFGFPQDRYMKIEYLKNHKNYNTFLIGGSKSGVIKTEDVDRYFPGAKTYNLSTLGGIVTDFEKHVEWLVKNIPNLSHVLLQIDWPFGYSGHDPKQVLGVALHPDISDRFKYSFLFDYLAKINPEGLKEKIDNNAGGLNRLNYDFTKGYWHRPLRDKQIDINCDKYYSSTGGLFNDGSKHRKKLTSSELNITLATIARIKSLLDKKNVKLTVFLPPQTHYQLDTIELSDYELFVKQLVKITDFYDFMYYNKITNNKCNYYEIAHYRPYVGEWIVRSLAEQPNKQSDIYRYFSKESLIPEWEYIKSNFLPERSSGI
ncbi:MAG: hypothetical protein WAW61_21620 [Methylococcaceae bacterium]